MGDLRTAIAAANKALAQGSGSKFMLQELRQAGSDLARFQVLHDDANGMNISRTDVSTGLWIVTAGTAYSKR